jgi:hypothetical protein
VCCGVWIYELKSESWSGKVYDCNGSDSFLFFSFPLPHTCTRTLFPLSEPLPTLPNNVFSSTFATQTQTLTCAPKRSVCRGYELLLYNPAKSHGLIPHSTLLPLHCLILHPFLRNLGSISPF